LWWRLFRRGWWWVTGLLVVVVAAFVGLQVWGSDATWAGYA
jgi:hypothetical protein